MAKHGGGYETRAGAVVRMFRVWKWMRKPKHGLPVTKVLPVKASI